MKVVKKGREDDFAVLSVTASTAEVSEALNQASYQFCRQMGVHPIPNRTPAQMASEQLGIKDLDTVVAQQAIEAIVPKAVEKSGLIPVFMPKAEPKTPIKRGRTFQFDLHVVEKPTFEIDDYSPVAITVDPYVPDEKAVDAEIARLAEQNITFAATDPKPVEKGDHCLVKIVATQNGEEMKGLTTDGRTYSVGEGYMPDGFDEGILGMVPGETRSFSFEGPGLDDDYNEIMEQVDCTVTVLEIQKQVAPVINDEWVKTNMPMYKDVAELRADIAKSADRQRRAAYDDYVRNVAAAKFAERFTGKIPDAVYEGTMRDIQSSLRQQVAKSGMTWEKFQEQQGGEQQVTMMLMFQTRQQLTQAFSLDALYRRKALTFTDTEINEVCRQMNPQAPQRVRQQMEATGYGYALKESAARLAASKYLVEHADITVREHPTADTLGPQAQPRA